MHAKEGVAGGALTETGGPAGGLGGDQEDKEGAELLQRLAVSQTVEADRRGVHQVSPCREHEEEEQVRTVYSN